MHEKRDSAHLTSRSTPKDKSKRKKVEDKGVKGPNLKKHKSFAYYFFCNMSGHMKKECMKYKACQERYVRFCGLFCG